MRIVVAAIGRMKPSPERDLVAKYSKQLSWPLQILEHETKKNLSTAQRQQAEASWLLEATATCDRRLVLDERGNAISSEKLASQFARWQQAGESQLGIVIGGADGLHESVRAQADLLLSFGQLTWPHMLVRAMLCEQLYRASTILAGHPYHRS